MDSLQLFKPYLEGIDNLLQKERLETIFTFIDQNYPNLKGRIAWNQPMYTYKDTFIIAFSVSKKHIAVSPEQKGIIAFKKQLEDANYVYTQMIFRIPNDAVINLDLLRSIINYNIEDKKELKTFWRKG